ncbi:MAG: L-serine ammonia-lyase, iron-sulfur-dependent subunit beta [Blautia sp.]|nr:L-serine ammonia-lyase, iron-sulfur-dependent subunit beta [Blautia sp.]
MNIFDILGPIMVGPSSSHTAGAVRIGYITRLLLGSPVMEAEIGLHGSFAATGRGHGTDRALIAGLLGMSPDDMRISRSFEEAEKEHLKFSFQNIQISGAHPNTALLKVQGINGKDLCVQASSLGGGRIMLNKLDGIEVNCACENPTLIVWNKDKPGYVAEVTTLLTRYSVNIATLNLHRDKKGGSAVMIIESDQSIPEEVIKQLKAVDGISKVIYLMSREEI